LLEIKEYHFNKGEDSLKVERKLKKKKSELSKEDLLKPDILPKLADKDIAYDYICINFKDPKKPINLF